MHDRDAGGCRGTPSCPRCVGGESGCRTLVRRAAGEGEPGRLALSAFCERAWQPVYRYIRARGCRADEAEDLTQSYFTRFIEKGWASEARAWRGCFRPFLCVSVRHHLANERDRERAARRGGRRPAVSLDAAVEAGRPGVEPVDALSPEVLLERRRAEEALARAVAALRRELEASGRGERFARLEARLLGEGSRRGDASLAAEWGVGESAVRVAVHRLRRRLEAILRERRAPGPVFRSRIPS